VTSKVNNPLSVIGIFSTLTEVVGATVLPFLSERNQNIFIWFIVIFPVLLVGLFFLTLFLKHNVLYAPGDFREDKTYLDALKTSKSTIRDNTTDGSSAAIQQLENVNNDEQI